VPLSAGRIQTFLDTLALPTLLPKRFRKPTIDRPSRPAIAAEQHRSQLVERFMPGSGCTGPISLIGIHGINQSRFSSSAQDRDHIVHSHPAGSRTSTITRSEFAFARVHWSPENARRKAGLLLYRPKITPCCLRAAVGPIPFYHRLRPRPCALG